jgi:hypothetical protein
MERRMHSLLSRWWKLPFDRAEILKMFCGKIEN